MASIVYRVGPSHYLFRGYLAWEQTMCSVLDQPATAHDVKSIDVSQQELFDCREVVGRLCSLDKPVVIVGTRTAFTLASLCMHAANGFFGVLMMCNNEADYDATQGMRNDALDAVWEHYLRATDSGVNFEGEGSVVAIARCLATAAHSAIDQRRKYSNAPYIVHPQAVAEAVSSVTTDKATIAAAWLHDVVEDTPIGLEDIEVVCGADVAKLVDDLTDVSIPTDGNRRIRKEIDRHHLASADPRAKSVKLADIISNLEDFKHTNLGFASVFLAECQMLMEVLREGDSTLIAEAKRSIRMAQRHLETIGSDR